MYPNLNKELDRKGITNKAVAAVLGCSEKTVWNKKNGESEFTLDEALNINDNLLPEFSLRYLFQKA